MLDSPHIVLPELFSDGASVQRASQELYQRSFLHTSLRLTCAFMRFLQFRKSRPCLQKFPHGPIKITGRHVLYPGQPLRQPFVRFHAKEGSHLFSMGCKNVTNNRYFTRLVSGLFQLLPQRFRPAFPLCAPVGIGVDFIYQAHKVAKAVCHCRRVSGSQCFRFCLVCPVSPQTCFCFHNGPELSVE